MRTMVISRDLAEDICLGLRITHERAIVKLREQLETTDAPVAVVPDGVSEEKRERFEKWVLDTKHPVFGFLDSRSLARSDDFTGYADEYVQGLWVAFNAFDVQP